MNKLKLLAVGMVLTLTGAVFAFSGGQSAWDSCPMGGGDADCCKKAEASCCKKAEGKTTEGTCPFCKKK
jgi:hypothetical protein